MFMYMFLRDKYMQQITTKLVNVLTILYTFVFQMIRGALWNNMHSPQIVVLEERLFPQCNFFKVQTGVQLQI